VISLFFATALAPHDAAAATAKERAAAKALVTKAASLEKAKRWSDAADALREAERLDPSPDKELELGRALAGAGKLVEALRTLRPLASSTGAAPRKQRPAAKKQVAEIEARVGHVRVATVPPDASVTIDDASVSDEVELDPGAHVVRVEAAGFAPSRREIRVVAGERDALRVELEREANAAAVVAAPAEPTSGPTRWPIYASFAVGAVGLGVGAVFGALAIAETSSAKGSCVNDTCRASVGDEIATAQRNGNVSTAAFVVGGAFVATGAVLFFVLPRKTYAAGDAATGAITPYVSPRGVGVAGSF
jgi:hypothetical protein